MFKNRERREKDSEIGWKEGGGIEMSTTVLPLRDARSPSLEVLTWIIFFSSHNDST